MKDLTPVIECLKNESAVKFAYLFGSKARGTAGSLSDTDIAVYLNPDCDMTAGKLDIIGQLIGVLGSDRFDLVILNTAPLPLAARIIRCQKVLVDRDSFLRHRYESRIIREYFDFSYLEESILKRRFALGR